MSQLVIIAHNIRSAHNVGSIFRTAEGFGVEKIIISGYTSYPMMNPDPRLPHIARKIDDQIHKTALDAERFVPFELHDLPPFDTLRAAGYRIVALEQDAGSITLSDYQTPDKVALLIGEEVHGIAPALIKQCDDIVEIPMVGKKESFNVSVATGIALYQLSQ